MPGIWSRLNGLWSTNIAQRCESVGEIVDWLTNWLRWLNSWTDLEGLNRIDGLSRPLRGQVTYGSRWPERIRIPSIGLHSIVWDRIQPLCTLDHIYAPDSWNTYVTILRNCLSVSHGYLNIFCCILYSALRDLLNMDGKTRLSEISMGYWEITLEDI